LNKQFSIYLDLIRFSAALMVFISHVPSFSGGWLWQISGFGHEAVVIFFVLSGFVISFVVYDKNESALKYISSRLSRVYSVAIPAIILTLILYYLGQEINENAFNGLNERLKDPIWTFFSALFFLNQSWLATPTFSNLPYWSLGYEVLYYAFFGILIYLKGSKKIVLLILVSLLMGPSILLYLPIWFAGVYCFKSLKKYNLSTQVSLFLYILSILGIIFFSLEAIQNIINSFMHDMIGSYFISLLLEPAEQFSSDYILTIFVTLHIFSSYYLIKNFNIFNEKLELIIREFASHTFSLYLFHMPMLYFVSAALPYESNPAINLITSWLIVPVIIFFLSRYTENKKHTYKTFFEAILKKI